MTALSGTWRVWGFPALLLLTALLLAGREGFNRIATPQTRLQIAECRLDIALERDGLPAAILPGHGPLSLRVARAYAPPDTTRPVAARLADNGVHPDRPAIRGFILVEQDGRPQGDSPGNAALLARDFAADAATLRQRYADRPGAAVLRGVISARVEDGAVVPGMAAAQTVLALPPALKQTLRALPAQPAGESCRSRYLADITVGALGAPRLSGIRMLNDAKETAS